MTDPRRALRFSDAPPAPRQDTDKPRSAVRGRTGLPRQPDMPPAHQGTYLGQRPYRNELLAREPTVHDVWIIERHQHPSGRPCAPWETYLHDYWRSALAMITNQGPAIRDSVERTTRAETVVRRLTLVEPDLTPCMQWHLHMLRARARFGEAARIAFTTEIADIEADRPMPDKVVLGTHALYHVQHRPDGALDGAYRFGGKDIVEEHRAHARTLFNRCGAPADEWFTAHRIDTLPPPTPGVRLAADQWLT